MVVKGKHSGILVGICLLLLFGNHYVINWEEFTQQQVESNFIELIREQRADLELWSSRENGNPDFRKRTLCKGRLVEWSDDRPFVYENSADSITIVENEYGQFLIQNMTVGGCQFISGYPLYFNYSITNQYLQNGKNDKLHQAVTNISVNTGDYHFNDLFYYNISSNPSSSIDAVIAFVLLLVLLVEYWKFGRSNFQSFLWATGLVVFLRLISLKYDALQLMFRFDLFDPIFYTSSFFNPTLGDILFNSILIWLISLTLVAHFQSLAIRGGWLILSILGFSLSLLLFHYPWSILSNSQILLDVGESIQFGWLRIVAYMAILIVAWAYFLYLFRLQQILHQNKKVVHSCLIGLILGTLLLPIKLLLGVPILFTVLMIFLSSKLDWGHSLKEFNYANLLYALILAIGIGLIFALVIYKHDENAELESKRKFANYLLLKQDVLGEFYLNQSINKLSQDSTISIIASEGSKEELEEKIKQEFISPYFDKYELEIIFQDYQRLRLNTRFTKEYSQLTIDHATDYPNIYFIDEGTNFKYISKVNFGDLVGLIILQIKKRVPTTVYPALLTDSKFVSFSDNFDYAVFADDEVLFHRSKFGRGEWPPQEDFANPDLYDEGIERNGRHYFGIQTTDGRVILIISDKYSIRALLSNFSFFFLLLLTIFGVYSTFASLVKNGMSLNFTSKIQFYLTLAFVIPLLTSGFALLSTLNTSYKEEIDRSYLKQALYISEMLSDQLETEMDDNIRSKFLTEIGDYIQSDISFYNESGYLIATSQPDIFTLNLQSNLINPIVFDQLIFMENQSMIAEESIGKLDHKVCYAVVNTADSEVAGFIAMPFFDSKNHLRRQQIEVFGNLITIFGLIFILAILVGNWVLNNLMHPLRMVAGKIRHVTLQDVNQPILYESSDEIGSLVKDYNHMLVKLEESKLALAKSQKETAWKEIARQVAHEIKNPLTPMQLKIQQMLRRNEAGTKDYEALSSLLTQVDTLSQIAGSFSAFAEMPAPDNKLISWELLVEEVMTLYQSDNVNFTHQLDKEVVIEADEDIFRRILNNIVLNAIQSVEPDLAEIHIGLEKKSGKAVLSVSDNGRGIPDELRDKIFLNYFSTKTTGSGIGLALAKKGIENAGGNIWFESNQGKGTTFYISMPLVEH